MAEPAPLTDLLRATAAEDREAFGRLYAATSAKLFGVVLRIVQRRDWSEEILQETYLRIWQHAQDFRPEKGRPMTWMITIARNRALEWRRRDKGEASLEDSGGAEELAAPNPGPLDWALAGVEARMLQNCLGELVAEQRDCIVLAYCEGYTHQELSARMTRPIGTVKSWIRRGLHLLKDCIER